ncbi:hypothetical protein [Angelakisella massiliensis]|nr:hypothetical protein [Angelakisella massiliensis]
MHFQIAAPSSGIRPRIADEITGGIPDVPIRRQKAQDNNQTRLLIFMI